MSRSLCGKCFFVLKRTDNTLLCCECNYLYHKDCVSPNLRSVNPDAFRCKRHLPLSPKPLTNPHTVPPPSSLLTTPPVTSILSKKRQASPTQQPHAPVSKQRCSSLPSPHDLLSHYSSANSTLPANTVRTLSFSPPAPSPITSRIMGEQAPPWFLAEAKASAERFQLEAKNNAERHEIVVNKLDKLESDSLARDKLYAVTDEPELLVHGLPLQFQGSLFDASRLVLYALGFGHNHDMPAVIQTREWNLPPPASRSQSLQQNTATQQPPQRSFVFLVGSSTTRDTIIRASAKLLLLNASKIFHCGGNTKVTIRAIWPKPVFDLLNEARIASQNLGYARPLVKNLRVFVRQTPKSELIPIISSSDLGKLTPVSKQRSVTSPKNNRQPRNSQPQSSQHPASTQPPSLPSSIQQHHTTPIFQPPNAPTFYQPPNQFQPSISPSISNFPSTTLNSDNTTTLQ